MHMNRTRKIRRRPLVMRLEYINNNLIPWAPLEVERSRGVHLVMRTDTNGARTIIEQPGHPVPVELAAMLGAKVRHYRAGRAS